ncbi:MAG: hypothetical protein HQL70_08190 [Magnetococcales bacterium]|nr:hypothetical protein [Magnetococcales bacterium]
MKSLDFETARLGRILVAIAFHYDSSRFTYLSTVLTSLAEFPVEKLHVTITTNTDNQEHLLKLSSLCNLFSGLNGKSFSIIYYQNLSDPLLLTWCHKHLITDQFLGGNSQYSHFIYLEDDMKFSFGNYAYFVTYRKMLSEQRVIPSFLRVEFSNSVGKYVNTDHENRIELSKAPKLQVDERYTFINPPNPYCAFYILDIELANEYVKSPSFTLNGAKSVVGWRVRELSAMALTFENIPHGFSSRYVIPVAKQLRTTPLFSWVFHLPNNYADGNNPFTKGHNYGTIGMDDIFSKA